MKESIFAGNAANLALTPLFTTRLIQNKIKNSSKKYSRYHITFPDQIFRIHELLVPDTLWAVSSQEPGGFSRFFLVVTVGVGVNQWTSHPT